MRTPRILVTDGWIADQNGSLTEVVIPSSVKTLQAPTKVTFNGTVLNAVPSAAARLQEFEAPNCTSTPVDVFKNYTGLLQVNMNAITSLNESKANGGGTFYGCTKLHTVNLDSLMTLTFNTGITSNAGTFYNCTSLTSVSLNSVTSIDYRTGSGSHNPIASPFGNCTSLKSIRLPSLKTLVSQRTASYGTGCAFYNCTGLETVDFPVFVSSSGNLSCFNTCPNLQNVTLGSEGHPVQTLSQYTFSGCTQSSLTITVYTQGGASLANSPWGATNATIVYEEA